MSAMHLTEADLNIIDDAGDAWPGAIEAASRAVFDVGYARGLRSETRETIAYIEALRYFGSRRKPIYRRTSIKKKDDLNDSLGMECRRGLSVLRLCSMRAARAVRGLPK